MYQLFQVRSITSQLIDKTITVKMSYDINADTVNDNTIQIFDRKKRNQLPISWTVENDTIIIKLKDWPTPNLDYIFYVNAGIESVFKTPLSSGVKRRIQFQSRILSLISITSPSDHEKLSNIKIEWEENTSLESIKKMNINLLESLKQQYPNDLDMANNQYESEKIEPASSYRVQIGTDSSFYNIAKDTLVQNDKFITIEDLIPETQYFARVRGEKQLTDDDRDGEYGSWSEIVTFTCEEVDSPTEPTYNERSDNLTDDSPIFIDTLEVLRHSKSATFTDTISIEFDAPLDPTSISQVIIINSAEGIEQLAFTAIVTGPYLNLTLAEPLVNAKLEIHLTNVKSADRKKELDYEKLVILTKYEPAYCSIEAVRSLIRAAKVSDEDTLYNIREASKFVNYFNDIGLIKDGVPFEVEQYVRHKTAYDCLLGFYVDKAAQTGSQGTVGDVEYKTPTKLVDLTKLLGELADEVKKWEDALRGHKKIGRVAPMSAVKGKHVTPQFTDLNLNYNRGVNGSNDSSYHSYIGNPLFPNKG